MGGGYTAQKSNICCITHNILATHKRARRERERRETVRERNKNQANQAILGPGLSIFQKLNYAWNTLATSQTCYMFSRNPMDSLQNAGVPI